MDAYVFVSIHRCSTSPSSSSTYGQCHGAGEERHNDGNPSVWSELLEDIEQRNVKRLQEDLGKLLMSISQGFIHIIVYTPDSVCEAIADALGHKKNSRVYYPSGKGVGKNGLISQFIDQLLCSEGFCRQRSQPCALFELQEASKTTNDDKSLQLLGDDSDDEEDEDIQPESELCN